MFSQRVKYAIQILAEFERAKRDGVRLKKRYFQEECGLEQTVVSEVIRLLHVGRWVDHVGYDFFSVRDLTDATLYDLLMVVDGRISMDTGIHEGWSSQNQAQSTNAKEIIDSITANFINEIRSVKLSEMFECYAVTDRRTLIHMRRIDWANTNASYRQAK